MPLQRGGAPGRVAHDAAVQDRADLHAHHGGRWVRGLSGGPHSGPRHHLPAAAVGPGGHCSPRHRVPFISRNEGSKCGGRRVASDNRQLPTSKGAITLKKRGFKVCWTTWQAIFVRPYVAEDRDPSACHPHVRRVPRQAVPSRGATSEVDQRGGLLRAQRPNPAAPLQPHCEPAPVRGQLRVGGRDRPRQGGAV